MSHHEQKERFRDQGFQRGEGNPGEVEKRKCLVNKDYPALQIILSGEKQLQ